MLVHNHPFDVQRARHCEGILESLESEARKREFTRSVLETAIRQPEAIALYRSCGYHDIEPFGPYIGSARSVCLGKAL